MIPAYQNGDNVTGVYRLERKDYTSREPRTLRANQPATSLEPSQCSICQKRMHDKSTRNSVTIKQMSERQLDTTLLQGALQDSAGMKHGLGC
jgi:tRNA U54 and U55 pseudouridine synthase Pus10